MSAITPAVRVVKAEPSRVRFSLGGTPDFRANRATVVAELDGRESRERAGHGALGLLTIDELKELLAAMDDADDTRHEKRVDRARQFEENFR